MRSKAAAPTNSSELGGKVALEQLDALPDVANNDAATVAPPPIS
jgi:hypothetical protein